MKSNDFKNIACPIADVLAILGDKWAGLILRDIILGKSKYSEFSENSNITHGTLSNRLKHLEQNGLITKFAYQHAPARYGYALTEKGQDMALVMLAMAEVGQKWNLSGWENVPLQAVNVKTGNPVRLAVLDRQTEREVPLTDLNIA